MVSIECVCPAFLADISLGDDSVFDDLKISREEYSKVPTTW